MVDRCEIDQPKTSKAGGVTKVSTVEMLMHGQTMEASMIVPHELIGQQVQVGFGTSR